MTTFIMTITAAEAERAAFLLFCRPFREDTATSLSNILFYKRQSIVTLEVSSMVVPGTVLFMENTRTQRPKTHVSVSPGRVIQYAAYHGRVLDRNLLTLGHEFEARCSHEPDFCSQKTKQNIVYKWRTTTGNS